MKRFLVATCLVTGLVAAAPAVSAQPLPASTSPSACHWFEPECWPTYNWLRNLP